jgi:hypothetical protein
MEKSNIFGFALYRTSADLFKTAFDLMVSVTLFVGRFDMRMMQVRVFPLELLLNMICPT